MQEKLIYVRVEKKNGKFLLYDVQGQVRMDIYVRDIMCQHSVDNNQCLEYDSETGR